MFCNKKFSNDVRFKCKSMFTIYMKIVALTNSADEADFECIFSIK